MRSFLTVPASPLLGPLPPASALKLCSPRPQKPMAVAVLINWAIYGVGPNKPSQLISLKLPQNVTDQLGQIGSVYIDNYGNSSSVYVQAQDTGFTITAPPNSAAWYPVITNDFDFNLVILGAGGANVPTTSFYFTNQFVPPNTDVEAANAIALYSASQNTQQGFFKTNNTAYGTPGLGDQTSIHPIQPTVTPPITFTCPELTNVAGGYVLLNGWTVSYTGFQNSTPMDQIYQIELQDLTLSQTLLLWNISCEAQVYRLVEALSGVNLFLTGAHSYKLVIATGPIDNFGVFLFKFVFTSPPAQ